MHFSDRAGLSILSSVGGDFLSSLGMGGQPSAATLHWAGVCRRLWGGPKLIRGGKYFTIVGQWQTFYLGGSVWSPFSGESGGVPVYLCSPLWVLCRRVESFKNQKCGSPAEQDEHEEETKSKY